MTHVPRMLLIIILLWMLQSVVTLISAQDFPDPGSYTAFENFETIERSYRIYIPSAYADPERSEPIPLVIALHGAGDTHQNFEFASGLSAYAEQLGFIVIYPQATEGYWNVGQSDPLIQANDTQWIHHIVTYFLANLDVDPERIFATGFSAGGMMSYRLGCEMNDQIRAIAVVGSTMPEFVKPFCDDSDPVPILILHGMADTVVPIDDSRVNFFSLLETLEYWIEHNKCDTDTMLTDTQPIIETQGSDVDIYSFLDCEGENQIKLITVEDGQHFWFGMPYFTPPDVDTLKTQETVLDFFNGFEALSDE